MSSKKGEIYFAERKWHFIRGKAANWQLTEEIAPEREGPEKSTTKSTYEQSQRGERSVIGEAQVEF